jgi:drug/metabolite transporter (DMT)-like permease
MLVAVFSWALYSTLLKKRSLPFTQFELLQIFVTIGLFFLFPQYLAEHYIGKEINYNKAFFSILAFVVIFPSIFAFYAWQKAIEIIGPTRSSIFLHLMPLFGAIMAIVIFRETFELYHFIGAGFIISGIYLSNLKKI